MTTDPPVPDAAVQIAADALPMRIRAAGTFAHLMCEALAAAGWLHDPATVNCGEGHDPTRICCAHTKDVKQLRARVAELEAENKRLRGELAAAESTIQALEDPELRTALTTPTTGDHGPVPPPHRCAPPMEPHPATLPSGTRWTCPEDRIEWTSVKRMVNRKMYGEWRPR